MSSNERFDRSRKSLQSSSNIFLRQSFNTSGALQLQGHIDSIATVFKEDRTSNGIECQIEVRLTPCISVGFGFSGDARGRRDLTNIRSLIGGFRVDSNGEKLLPLNRDDDGGQVLN